MDGGARFCMSLVEEFNTVSHTPSRGYVKHIPGGKEGTCIVMAPPAPCCPSSDLLQPVLSGDTESNVKSFEGFPLSSYTMGK